MNNLTIGKGIVASAIMCLMFVAGSSVTKAAGCDNYNGPISLHADPDRFYPINPAFRNSEDKDYNTDTTDNAYESRERDGSFSDSDHNTTTTRVETRETHEYDSDKHVSSDASLTRKIHHALHNDSSLSADARNVTVHVRNGVVTLRGSVDSHSERHRVVSKAEHIAGTDNVNSRLSVSPQ
jgi:osmotically-inducible protein OsmY